MKNRKSISYHNLIATKISAPVVSDESNNPNKNKSTTLEFLKKSSEILQSYKAIFSKPPIHNFGDADRVFRESLRKYDNFDASNIFSRLKILKKTTSANQLKFDKRPPFGNVTRQKPRFRHKKLIEKATEQRQEPVINNNLQIDQVTKKHEEEDELEVFYSPNSQLEFSTEVLKLESKDKESIGDIDSGSENEFKMADEELQEVEDLVQQAEGAINDVVAENQILQETMFGSNTEEDYSEEASTGEANTEYTTEKFSTETDEEARLVGGDTQAVMGYDPNIDSVVIKELEDAEQQAMETAKIIYELKQRVAQLLSKEKMTELEAKELEEKNKQLKEQMTLFEAKTKRIQFLIDQASMFENLISSKPRLQEKHNEDMLPKVVICGLTEHNIPKIIVCDDKKKSRSRPRTPSFPTPPTSVMPQFAKKLSESYCMQERLAAENADLEDKRYKLQEDLLDKDHTVDSLQRKLQSLQAELRMVCKENCLLSEKLSRIESCPNQQAAQYTPENSAGLCKKHQKMPCGKNKGPCPADIESRLQEYSDTTQQLEKQLCQMECEVRNMQSELVAVQKERQHLEQHRRMLTTPPPCTPPPCGPPCMPPPCNIGSVGGGGSDQQLRELREQYNRLQDDYKGKLTEVAGLRADIEKLKQNSKDAEEARKVAEDKVKEYEKELKSYKSEKSKFMGSKEQLIEQEQQLNVAKQRFREAQDELEELRALIQDQQAQLDDYRNKYLQAQQQVEEQRRQIDMMEMENNRISEQVNLEIQRVKNQFQEKLQELTPLPDILKATQLKLQEAQQMHLLAERNNENLIHELQAYRDKAAAMANQMEKVRSDQQLGVDEKVGLQQRQQELEQKITETEEEVDRLQRELVRTEEVADQNEKRVQEKLHEIAQLVAQLETVREESARQVARTKDRCETVRRSMQNQIADLERQLAQSRAQARTAQKDRDDIRQKMQAQINNLNENFEDAQMRIRNLQGHVNFLKNSYTTVFPNEIGDVMETCDCGNAF
ncbi:hypothetical protein RI129_009129 [Pyrocoelia pectoralis]|uniref:Uncharacterized protein n=1 Tax=Pyrocoelia pectoralis TaxID=417401 RepID=A0AAN7ZGJ7_9COLE